MPSPQPVLLDSSFPLPLAAPFTRTTALHAGVNDKQLGRLVRSGLLRRPVVGAYVASQAPDSIDLRAAALGLVVPKGSFVCDRAAAWLHGAPSALAPNEHLSVPQVNCYRPADEGRLRNGLCASGERTIRPGDLVELHGVLVTTPLRTALDLGRLQRNPDIALAGMDAMLRLKVFTLEELLAEVPRFARQRGVLQLRALAPIANGKAASAAESALRRRWHVAGLPTPELQIEVELLGRVVYYIDMGLRELIFGAEYDGEDYHSSEEQVGHDAGRRTWLREERHWQMEVFVRANVYGRLQDAEQRLQRAFVEARSTLASRTYIV